MADPLTTNKKSRPDFVDADTQRCASAIQIVRDVSGGTPAMRLATTKYLFEQKKEDPADYKSRLNRSVFFDAYSRTVQSLVGVVFKEDIKIVDDVPAVIKQHLEDVDLAGNHLDVFCKRQFTDQFEGCSYILVDMEPALDSTATLADERALNRRPFWVGYKADQAINKRRKRVNGRDVFTQITFKEYISEPDGDYGEKAVVKYRTFRLNDAGIVEWELNRENPDAKTEEEKIIFEARGITTLKRIPVAVAGEIGKPPPLLGLAYLNISHWQHTSDQGNILNVAGCPALVMKGRKSEDIALGVSSLIDIPTDGDAFWLEIKYDGAIKTRRDYILDIEQRMGMLGLAQLAEKQGSSRTATEVRQDYQHTHSELSTAARSAKDCYEQCLSFHAEYLGLPSGGSLELGVAEESLILTPQHMQVALTALVAGKISLELFLTMFLNLLENAGVLAEDVTVEEEVERITEATKIASAVGLPAIAKKNLPGASPPIQKMFGASSGNGAAA